MPLISTREILNRAMGGRYAVGAFNVGCLDMLRPIVEAAEAEKAPIIIQMAPAQVEFATLDLAGAAMLQAAGRASVPIAVHLDHGKTFEENVRCLRAGFTSLMLDGSSLPYEDNVRLSQQIVALGHAAGIAVEAELGRVMRVGDNSTPDDIKALMTDPDEAKGFVDAVDADFLAVAVGTVHSMIKRTAEIDLPRIAAIRENVRRPLVLHGGSGVPHDVLAEAVANGICKVNVSTELNKQFHRTLVQELAANPDQNNPRIFLVSCQGAVLAATREKIRLFGSSGKAW